METRQPIQLQLNLESGVPSEARIESIQGVETVTSGKQTESQVKFAGLMAKMTEESEVGGQLFTLHTIDKTPSP
mgnify:CR=1 FL=1